MKGVALAVTSLLMAANAGVALAQEKPAVEKGRTVFAHYCAPCHASGRGADGAPMLPGTHALQLKYKGTKPALLEQRTDLSFELIKTFVRNGVASMPPFRKTEVTDDDLKAISAYLAATARNGARARN
jgi:mono/diheme cytochrome c family protein